MGRHHYFDWSPRTRVRLTDLYRQGLSFGIIARTLGCTRASAIAKARRLGITNRESPIHRNGAPIGAGPGNSGLACVSRVRAARQEAHTTYTETREFPGIDDDIKTEECPNGRNPADLSDLPGFSNFGVSWEERWRFGGTAPGMGFWRPRTCQFIGRPEDREQRKCGADVVVGRAYCARHLAICTVQPPGQTIAAGQSDTANPTQASNDVCDQ